jgi:hypothetical protein
VEEVVKVNVSAPVEVMEDHFAGKLPETRPVSAAERILISRPVGSPGPVLVTVTVVEVRE